MVLPRPVHTLCFRNCGGDLGRRPPIFPSGNPVKAWMSSPPALRCWHCSLSPLMESLSVNLEFQVMKANGGGLG